GEGRRLRLQAFALRHGRLRVRQDLFYVVLLKKRLLAVQTSAYCKNYCTPYKLLHAIQTSARHRNFCTP
ncbi:hypothetical protein BgiBS90_011668, partial [Biomphalaria glabrata]